MTRRRFYAPQVSFAADGKSVTLSVDEARHARDVLRLARGDEVFVFDGEGREFQCDIAELTSQSADLNVIEEVEPTKPESSLDLTLAVALLKSEKFELVVQKLTELGVTQITPLLTDRADVKLREPRDAQRKLERCQRIALEATKQCGRARLIRMNEPTDFRKFLQANDATDLKMMFTEREGGSLADAIKTNSKPAHVAAIVGPEGGWSDEEIRKASIANWSMVTLGGRILRAETAAIAVAALLQHQFGDLI